MTEEEEEEKIYTVPLRTGRSGLRTERTRTAIKHIKEYVARHMKGDVENVWVDPRLNEAIWSKGIKHPPHKVRVKVLKFEDDLIEVSLPEK